MDVSVCIVNLNAKKHLDKCIKTIPKAIGLYEYEIIVVDNNSKDGSRNFIKKNFPLVSLLVNYYNDGYTRAINKALKKSLGNYKVVLNPDTILMPNSIGLLIKFLKENDSIGIVGPKVINNDGSFQPSCKRGIARPYAVFSYFFGLSKLFPKNRKFAEYHLSYLDHNEINEVNGVSGSCMVFRENVINDIGFFDEQYFAYQEDSDFCLRAQENGWKIYYNPNSIIKHLGGQGGANSVPFKAIFEWHNSYYKYYFKHFSNDYSILFNIFYSIIMFVKLIFSIIFQFIKR